MGQGLVLEQMVWWSASAGLEPVPGAHREPQVQPLAVSPQGSDELGGLFSRCELLYAALQRLQRGHGVQAGLPRSLAVALPLRVLGPKKDLVD